MEIVELAAGARVQRRVRGDAGEHAPAGRLLYFVEIGGVQKKLHPGPPYTMTITGETRATARMDSVMRCRCVGCVLRDKRTDHHGTACVRFVQAQSGRVRGNAMEEGLRIGADGRFAPRSRGRRHRAADYAIVRKKQVRSPVWQAGPAGCTSASSVSASQS